MARFPAQTVYTECVHFGQKTIWLALDNSSLQTLGELSTGRPQNQDRIARVAHDRLGHTAEHPPLHTGTPMRAHGDQSVGNLSRHCDNFVRCETFFSRKRDFLESFCFISSAFIARYLTVSARIVVINEFDLSRM